MEHIKIKKVRKYLIYTLLETFGKSFWRRDGDSNPGYAFDVYTLSRRAP